VYHRSCRSRGFLRGAGLAECLAVCIDNGLPCKCEGDGPCEPGEGSLPKYEMRHGAATPWVGFQTYLKQPTACPWGASFLLVFCVGTALYVPTPVNSMCCLSLSVSLCLSVSCHLHIHCPERRWAAGWSLGGVRVVAHCPECPQWLRCTHTVRCG
jgi:hypothetical protein